MFSVGACYDRCTAVSTLFLAKTCLTDASPQLTYIYPLLSETHSAFSILIVVYLGRGGVEVSMRFLLKAIFFFWLRYDV